MEELYIRDEELPSDGEDAKSDMAVENSDSSTEESEKNAAEENSEDAALETDYGKIIAQDVELLKSEFPELRGISDITDLNNPLRYAALRDLGLTPIEAYMATAKRPSYDTRSHLKSALGKSAVATHGFMSKTELMAARDLFPGMSDSDIQRLYKKVNN